MDCYAYLLERLRQDDFRRLRAFRADGAARFTTWLVVVVRRLCFDHYRAVYGRQRDESDLDHQHRRALTAFTPIERDEVLANVAGSVNLEREFSVTTRRGALAAAVARLDAPDRLLLRLRFDDGLPAREIARIVSLATPFHVYRQVNRILVTLRNWLKEDGLDADFDS